MSDIISNFILNPYSDVNTTVTTDTEPYVNLINKSKGNTSFYPIKTKECGLCKSKIDLLSNNYAIIHSNGEIWYICWDCTYKRIGDKLVALLL